MNRFFTSPKFLVAATLATAALGAASVAEARPDVCQQVAGPGPQAGQQPVQGGVEIVFDTRES